MKRLLLLLLIVPAIANGQNWSGVLAPNRATDWTKAGIPGFSINGTVPSDSWTQCGTTIAPFGSSGSYASPATITNAVNHTSTGYTGCGANTYVKLGAGDFYLNAGMCFKIQNNELRGSGPTQTRVHFNSASTCQGGGAQVSIGFEDANGEYPGGVGTGVTPWTASYAQNGTTITVADASILGLTANQTIIVMDQCDTGYSGNTTGPGSATCASGASTDNGNFFSAGKAYVPVAHSGGTCGVTGTGITGTGFSASFGGIINLTISGVVTAVPFTFVSSTSGTIGQMVITSATSSSLAGTMTNVPLGSYACSFPTGSSYNDPNGGVGRFHRFQEEFHIVTACSPSCSNAGPTTLTLAAPLIHPNWASGQSPEVWSIQAYKNMGIRDLTIDSTGTGANPGLDFNNVQTCWAHNVVVHDTFSQGIGLYGVNNCDVSSNYVYNAGQSTPGTDPNPRDPSGIDINGSHILVANNIIQYSRIAIIPNGPASGNVVAYNYVNNCFESNGDLWGCLYDGHQNGTDFNLWEGNMAAQGQQDQTHGGKLMETWYRNFVTGWESCSNGQCSPNATQKNASLYAMAITSSNRYNNIVANVLGTPGVTTLAFNYTAPDQFVSSTSGYVYDYASGNGCSPGGGCIGGPLPIDPVVPLSTYKWGNWDAFHAATQFNASEVPSGISVYPQTAPTATCTNSLSCPASFYFTSRPAWYPASIAFPAIGPDVTSGNIGQCGGTLNAAGKFAGLPGTSSAQCGTGNPLNVAWGGHVNAIPAMACYLSIGGNLDGTSALSSSFDATTCYSGSAPVTFPLSVTKSGTGGGTVTSSPAGINCGSTCSASFTSGTPVTLTATPDGSSTFAGWSGACSGTTCNVTVNSNLSATATFTLNPPPGTAPTFSPGGATYATAQSVSVTSTNPLIFYTTDGYTPNTASTPYSSPISIISTTTLQAISAAGGSVRRETQALPVTNTSAGWKLCTPLFSNSNGTPTSGSSKVCGGGVGTNQPSTWTVTMGSQESISVSGTSGAPQILITLGASGCDSCTEETMDKWVKPLDANDLANVENHEMDAWHNDATHNRLHMGGLQCNQQSAFLQWQVDNEQGSWQNTGITDKCPLSTSLWTHVVFHTHWIIGDTGCGGLGCTFYDYLDVCTASSPAAGCVLAHHVINKQLETDNPGWGAGCADQDQVDLRSGVHTGGLLIQHNNVTCAFGVSSLTSAIYNISSVLNPVVNFTGAISITGQIHVH